MLFRSNSCKNVFDESLIPTARLRNFYTHWRGLCDQAPIPPRSAFDIVEVPPPLIPHLILLDVLEGGRDFRYRVVGTGVRDNVGRDFTGETVEAYHHSHESLSVHDGYIAVVEHGIPDLYRATLLDIDKAFISYDRLAAPLAAPDGRIIQILACFELNITPPGEARLGDLAVSQRVPPRS